MKIMLGFCVSALCGTVGFAASDRVVLPGHGEARLDVPSPPVPEVAYEPLWNSWYGYHTGYSAEDMEREGRIAAELGIGTMMYDMGWDREGATNTKDFAQCGDWISDVRYDRYNCMASSASALLDVAEVESSNSEVAL